MKRFVIAVLALMVTGLVTSAHAQGPAKGPGVEKGATAGKLLGLKMDEAKKTDFFTCFCLEQTSSDTDSKNRTVLTFKPSGKKFRKLVTVTVTLDQDECIHDMQLALSRSFIDSRTDGVFAHDIAKSLLRSSLSRAELEKVGDLIDEIEFGGNGMALTARKLPKLPDPPTPGYQTFLGKREKYEQDLGKTKLELRQQKNETEKGTDTLTIAVGPKEG